MYMYQYLTLSFLLFSLIHHGLVKNEMEVGREKSTQECGIHAEKSTVNEDNSFGSRYHCGLGEKEFHIYVSNFCLQSFPSKYRLIMHVFMHIDGVQPPLYVCKWCGEVFYSNVSLKKHLRTSENYQVLTAGNHENYGCSDKHHSSIFLDGEPDVSVREHNEHNSYKETWKASKKSPNDIYNTHTANDAEKTSGYGTLPTAVNVSADFVVLSANRTHKCDICGKSFATSRYLKIHMLFHTGKKSHKCDICGKSFVLLGILKRHKLVHTGRRPHKCDICGKSFAVLWALKTYSLIHTGKKPHKCDICGKSFATSGYFNKHV
ncbi:zinc finger protein 98-like [Schistocerca serialis cubense]|uniref:zinc finger protein 98-like n=1 Tax=Schistocerca serialis cubense TaxID=2023355 RepID=UPI00214EF6F5|nr:zinc finger protein 98-like [Schistocerca serialis cubense]